MTFNDVLALNISVNGVSDAVRGLEQVENKLTEVEAAAISTAKKGFAQLAALAAVVGAGIREAIADETVMARLEGITGSLQNAEAVMRSIDALGSEGVFGKDQIEAAAFTLERSLGGAFEKNIGLLKQLGVLMDGGIAQAAELIARLERGQTFGVAMQLGAAGIGPDKLRAQGLNVEGRTIKNSPAEILAALERITSQQAAYERMVNTTGAAWGRFKEQMSETLEGIGYPFLTALNLMLEPITFMLSAFRSLNEVTGGWASNVVVAMVAISAVTKILPLMQGLRTTMKELLGIETILAVIRKATWVNLLSGVQRFVGWLRQMLTVEKAMAVVEAVRVALMAAL